MAACATNVHFTPKADIAEQIGTSLCAKSGHWLALTRFEKLQNHPTYARGRSVAIGASSGGAARGQLWITRSTRSVTQDGELERLIVQSRFVEPITRRSFQEAGISVGMRVLDIGSGAGDVAFLPYDRCCQWIVEAFRGAGSDTNAAGNLYTAFAGAGLPSPQMRMQTFVGGSVGCTDWLQVVAGLAASLLPRMEQLGIATAADLEIATLAQRLQQEVAGSEHMIIGRSEIAAWSRLKVRELVCAPNTVMRALPA